VGKVSEKTLAEALATAQGEFKPIKKDKTAKIKTKSGVEFAYQYADWADILTMALPVLAKNGLAFTQPLRMRDGLLFVTSELLFGAEKLVSDGIPIKYDLMSPQEFGSCLSYWRRYDGCSLLGIQPDKDDDGQLAQESHKGVARAQAEQRFEQRDLQQQRISPTQAKAFWKAVKEGRKTENQVRAYLTEIGPYVQTEEIKQGEYNEAIRWASNPVPVPQDLLPALNESLSMANAKKKPLGGKLPMARYEDNEPKAAVAKPVDAAFWKSFWVLAKKHNVPEADIHKYAAENFGMEKSLTELNPVDIGKLVGWVSTVQP
jgi:hypothetical protein